MPYARALIFLLAACNPNGKSPGSDTGSSGATTTEGEPTAGSSGTTTTEGEPTAGDATTADLDTGGDPSLDDEGFCENFLNPLEPAEVPPGVVGEFYSVQFTVGGDVPGNFMWLLQSGELPPGLTFDDLAATLAGTPTLAGEYIFSIEARVEGDPDCPTKPESATYKLPIAP